MPVLTYPQRLDTAISVGLRCRSYQPHQGRTSPRFHLRIYPSPVRITTERGSKTNRAEVVPELYLLLSVSYTINCIHPYQCQLFRYWARVTLLPSVPTNQHAYHQGVQACSKYFSLGESRALSSTARVRTKPYLTGMVGQEGIEPTTRGFSILCCYLLSYRPM